MKLPWHKLPNGMMLLAEHSSAVDHGSMLGTFRLDMAHIAQQYATHGILGGTVLAELKKRSAKELRARLKVSSKALIRAAESSGLSYYKALEYDLEEALGKLDGFDLVFETFETYASAEPNCSRVRDETKKYLRGVYATAIYDESVDLYHFAESLKTKRRVSRRVFITRAGLAAGGFALGIVTKPLLEQLPNEVHDRFVRPRKTPTPSPSE